MTTVVSTGGGGGGLIMIVGLVIALIAGVWFYRQHQKEKLNQPPATVPAAPAQPPTGSEIPSTAPGFCNCATNQSCNAFCSNTAAFSLCCFNSTTPPTTVPPGTTLPPTTVPPTTEPLPDPNSQLCSSQFNGSCNTECGRNGDFDECEECNAICDSDVPYTGTDIQVPVPAGGALPTVSCPAGYVYNPTHNVCVASAAPVFPNTPVPPPLTSGPDPSRCSSVYNGSCNNECSSGSQSVCDDCMRSCGTGSSGGGGRTPACSSKYNGSCNTECGSGNNSTCNACKIACGLSSASIARAYSARDARKVLNNRMYNMFKRSNPEVEVEIDYRARKVKLGNLY